MLRFNILSNNTQSDCNDVSVRQERLNAKIDVYTWGFRDGYNDAAHDQGLQAVQAGRLLADRGMRPLEYI